MTASEPTDPKDNRPRLRHIRTVCRELIERRASAMGLTHDEFMDGFGLLPPAFLRAITVGLGGGTHTLTVHLSHEEDTALFALAVKKDNKVLGEVQEMGLLAIAARAVEDGGIVTVLTRDPEGGADTFRAWELINGRADPLPWQEAFEEARIYEPSKELNYADAFEPERHLRQVM
ncbi:hypothetical protein OG883_44115 [Streptomyces sp. NBC_01142]|uniref:hypothetical protein n=1 Tax=Streptomyces sp. NBC_01142 TaxID=2975865 RepID=UPI002256139B|nr:hypothetical protein [Streptomyces sp. NBC_01142]MCX4826629.1 hypothetical protein [Streptomyces sp. NBC_01142]